MFVWRKNSGDHPVTQEDMNMFLLAHKAMRRDFPALAGIVRSLQPDQAARLKALGAVFDTIYCTVKMHHTGEDHDFCPVLTAKVKAFAVHEAALVQQHKGLMTMLKEMKADIVHLTAAQGSDFAELQGKLAAKLGALNDYVEGHLRYEERDMVGCAKTCLTYKELRDIGRRSVKKSPLRDIALALPWVLSASNDAERRALLNELPLPARLIYRFWWKPGYERKVRPLSAA
jgi:Hemerythrin HHE cation binding domain